MKKLVLILLAICIMLPAVAIAAENVSGNPDPIGLELTVATTDTLKQLGYKTSLLGSSNVTGGPVYQVDTSTLGINGLQKANVIFDKQNVAQGVVLVFGKKDFDALANIVRKKYTVTSENIPFVGNKSMMATMGDTSVELNGPHMSFEVTLGYYTNNFNSAYEQQLAAKKQQQQQASMNNL